MPPATAPKTANLRDRTRSPDRSAEPFAPLRHDVHSYYRLAELGIIAPDQKTQLIRGEVLLMSPASPEHNAVIARLQRLLLAGFGDQAQVRVQLALSLNDDSEPDPDLSVVEVRADDYRHAHPGPADTKLLVEVARSSLRFDLGDKAELYAEAGIHDYWVIDVDGGAVEVHREPGGQRFAQRQRLIGDTPIAPLAKPDWSITPRQILND